MSDACGNASLTRVAWIFERTAPRMTGFCPGLIYGPTNDFGETDWWPEAARGLWSPNFDHFLAGNPNGAWKLFVIDGRSGPTSIGGLIANGWSLQLQTETADITVPAATGRYDGQADRYPATREITGLDGVIEDVDVSLDGVYHEVPADLELLLAGPGGQTVSLMDNACWYDAVRGHRWRWDDEAVAAMPATAVCSANATHRPTDHAPDDRLPDPAPAGPYGSALSALDGTDPNGEWHLYAHDQQRDDHTTGERRADGFFAKPFELHIKTRPRAAVTLTAAELTVAEGQAGELELARTGDGLGAGSVELTAAAGSAVPGDYAPEPIVVAFAAGRRSARIAVPVLADDEREGSEKFTLAFSGAEGDAQPGETRAVTITIAADPVPGGGTPPPGGGDGGGDTPGDEDPPGGDTEPPAITRLSLTPARFAVKRRTATTIAYTLSEPAQLALRIEREVTGRRKNGTCRPATRRNRNLPSCRRHVPSVTLQASGAAGTNRLPFNGRVRGRALSAGRYRIVAMATDTAGNDSPAVSRTFTVR